MDSYFVKQNHFSYKSLFGVIYFVIFIFIAYICARDKTVYMLGVAIMLIMLVVCIYFSCLLDRFGIYCKKNEVYFKKFKKRIIEPNTIVGVKIVKSEIDDKFGKRYLKDIHKNYLYSMILLKEIIPEMVDYQQGDLMFMHEFGEYSICSVVYDKGLIDYLKRLNTQISVI